MFNDLPVITSSLLLKLFNIQIKKTDLMHKDSLSVNQVEEQRNKKMLFNLKKIGFIIYENIYFL